MRNYEPDSEEQNELETAVAHFIRSVATMVPFIVAALAVGLLFNILFSEPFGFSCKSIPVERPSKLRVDTSHVFSPSINSDKAAPVEYMKSEQSQE